MGIAECAAVLYVERSGCEGSQRLDASMAVSEVRPKHGLKHHGRAITRQRRMAGRRAMGDGRWRVDRGLGEAGGLVWAG